MHCNASPPARPPPLPPPPPPGVAPPTPPLQCYFCHAKPLSSATWPMINAAGCGEKLSPSGGGVVPVRGRVCRRRPGPGGPPCGGATRGAAPGSSVRGGGGGTGFAARPPSPLCQAEYASVTAGQTLGVTDQDLRQSEAWLGNHQRLAGAIRAAVARPPPQVHRHSRGRGRHLARPQCGTSWRMVQQPP